MSYYSEQYPKVDDIVIVTISKIEKDAIYCVLLEYDNKEGFLPITGLDKKSNANPKSYFKTGHRYPMTVTNVEEDKIDISYNFIPQREREKYVNEFDFMAKIYSFTNDIILMTGLTKEEILSKTMHQVVNKDMVTSAKNDTKDIYFSILENPFSYMQKLIDDYPDDMPKLVDEIEKRIIKSTMIYCQEIDITVLCKNGVNVLKDILNITCNDYKIEYVNAPKYKLIAEGADETECYSKIKKGLDVIKKNIEKYSGIVFSIEDKKDNWCEINLAIAHENIRNILQNILNITCDGCSIQHINNQKYKLIAEGTNDLEWDEKIQTCLKMIEDNINKYSKIKCVIGNKVINRECNIFIKKMPERSISSMSFRSFTSFSDE